MKVVPGIQNPCSGESSRRFCLIAYCTSAVCLLLAVPALAIDVSFADFALKYRLPGDLRRAINFSEVFAHGLGVATICLVIWALDPSNRRSLYRIAICAFGAGLVANIVKLLIARQRPHAFLSQASPATAGVWDTFLGLFPHASQQLPDPGSHTVQSFPSAHTATAVGFAFALAWRYPRGKWLFATFAMMAAFQRMAVGAHYLSDTLVGAAIGALVAAMSLDHRMARLCLPFWKRDSMSPEGDSKRLGNAA